MNEKLKCSKIFFILEIGRTINNATVIGTASRSESQAWVKARGATHIINHSKSFSEELSRVGLDNVTHIISLTHTDQHYDQLVEIIAPQGKIALIDDPTFRI